MTELRLALKDEITAELGRIAGRLKHPERLMAGISQELRTITFDNFEGESSDGEKWQKLSSKTIAARTKKGHWPGKILRVSAGGLASSVTAFSSANEAGIGASKIYAAIQQLGGQAGRGKKVTIPERPYLPIRRAGSDFELTKDARDSILEMMESFVDRGAT